ncbi:MAG: S8 family serine peptidase, partial [Gammaproteobacteria bacterium]|nr:S8 family serine peptidase [Gammaproteobacteria bacterium]
MSEVISFTTDTSADTDAPILIGRPVVHDISDDQAIISWLTDESSSTQVNIGTEENNLTRTETAPGLLTNHKLLITSLSPSTTYYFSALSSDLSGNQTITNTFSFTTLSEEQPDTLKIIATPIIESLTGNSVIVSWKTNISSDSRLVCESVNGISEVNKIDRIKNHVITLTGLTFNTNYRCAIYSTDNDGFIASKVIGFKTLEDTDTSPPNCIAEPVITVAGTFAEYSWQSDELATAVIQYRITGDNQWLPIVNSTLSRSGFSLLTGLAVNTDYEHQVILTDAVGNSAGCTEGEFNSGPDLSLPAPVFSIEPFVDNIDHYSARVNWETDSLSSGQVRFGLSESQLNLSESDPDFTSIHNVVLNNLTPDTLYYLQVDAFNSEGLTTTSNIISFSTTIIPPVTVTPPKIIAGPIVKYITNNSAVIEWETDKVSDSLVVFSGGTEFSDVTLTTKHSVLVTELTPSTNYSTLVSSKDEYGNSSEALPANFTTLGIGDPIWPKFISGPTVFSIDYNRFTVSFCADEPVTAVVSISTAGSELPDYILDEASVCHELDVTGLTSNTLYTIEVSITDLAGNGPVTAGVTAKTLEEIDIAPPIITGPIVTDITTSTAIVRWTTNEVATSGVSYTDGNSSNAINYEELVIEHIVYLSGLTPSTTYTLTASSTDAVGNGPTVSEPVEFTTLGTGGGGNWPPEIIAGPFVEDITTNSAFIVWTTNEATSRLVKLGLSENALNQQFSLDGYATDHRVPVTGLSADTVYYFQVESRDLPGLKVTSDILSFKTLKEIDPEIELQISDGPDLISVTTESLTVSWLTNLHSDSRLVCEAEQGGSSGSSISSLATYNEVDPARAIKDRYIVLLKEEIVQNQMLKSAVSRSAMVNTISKQIALDVKGRIVRQYTNAVSGFVVDMKASEIITLQQNPLVLTIEQDQIMNATVTQTNATWGLDRIDQSNLPLDDAYNYSLDGTGINAYVIDTGVMVSHTDFGGRASHGWDFIDNDADASDCNGHGTHVAGTIGSSTYGVAKNVNLIAVRVLGCSGSGTNSGVIAGVDWVAENAEFPAVANMSLGGGNSSILDAAVDNAIDAGITFVVAAGNSNINACYGSPNKVPAAITVAASTSSDNRSGFSNWGSCIDIFAPGSGITSTWSNGGINTISGTSMAAPHVAGAAVLFLQAHPDANAADVDSGLSGFATKDKISNINGAPNLLLNADFAVDTPLKVSPPPPPPEKIRFEVSDDQLVKYHQLTLTGLTASTVYQCQVYSTDIENVTVSAELRGTTADIPDTTPPVCLGEPSATGFVDTAQI